MLTTTKGIRYPEGPDTADVPLWMSRLALDVDGIIVAREAMMAKWRTHVRVSGIIIAGSTGGSLGYGGNVASMTDLKAAFWIDPTDWNAAGATLAIRLKAFVATNNVNPGRDYTFTLTKIDSVTGASGSDPAINGFSEAGVGQTTVVNPGALGISRVAGAAQSPAPAAGLYVIRLSIFGGALAAGSNAVVGAQLEYSSTPN